MDDALVDEVRGVDGVLAAEGSVLGYARLTTADGVAIGDPANGAPALGLTWSDDGRINPLVVTEGRAPESGDEIVVDAPEPREVRDRPRRAHDRPRPGRAGRRRRSWGPSPSAAPRRSAARPWWPSTRASRRSCWPSPGKWDEISVVAEDGVSQETLTARLADVLPAGVEAVPGATVIEENQQVTREAMSFFTYFMDFFAVVALLVGAFMIFNTFSITVAQRTRQNGLLRALGATRRQVLASVLIEALVVGVLASVLGLLAGFGIATGLKALLDALGFGIPAGGLVFAPAHRRRRPGGRHPRDAVRRDLAGAQGGQGLADRRDVVRGRRQRRLRLPVARRRRRHLAGRRARRDPHRPVRRRRQPGARSSAVGCLGVFLGVYVLGRTISLPLSRAIGAPLPAAARPARRAGPGERDAQPQAHGGRRHGAHARRRDRGDHQHLRRLDQGHRGRGHRPRVHRRPRHRLRRERQRRRRPVAGGDGWASCPRWRR